MYLVDREQKKAIVSVEPKSTEKTASTEKDLTVEPEVKVVLPATPGQEVATTTVTNGTTTTETGHSFTSLCSLFCGTICQKTPLADYFTPKTNVAPLRSVLAELKLQGFSKDICRSMVAMLDADRSGKLGFQEFKELWGAIRQWKNVWLMYDTDKSGTFSGFELRDALNSAGFRLNNKVLNILMHRYGNKNGEMEFEDFMMCAIKLKSMMDHFKKKQQSGSNNATFSIDEWLESTLYS